eukprot:6204577-Pleurochrysis_carterae.AAC.1
MSELPSVLADPRARHEHPQAQGPQGVDATDLRVRGSFVIPFAPCSGAKSAFKAYYGQANGREPPLFLLRLPYSARASARLACPCTPGAALFAPFHTQRARVREG